jgi:RNA polymerase sigma factor (sigma-70 family)
MAARLSCTLLRTQNDQRLVALAAQGSEPAFEALVERYRRPLHAYCRRLLLPAEAAEDVVQQAFLSTWQALQRGTDVRDARAWLYRVTHNAALNALKRSGYDHAELDEALHGAGAPDEDLERRIAVRRTLAGLAALPELQREALLRTAVEGHSHEDVARALGVSDGAVRGLVYRARVTLRAAATALTPAPVVQWAASGGGSRDTPLAERVAELVAGGGAAGASALLTKGGAALLATGALAGGAVVVEEKALDGRSDRPADARAAESRSAGLSTAERDSSAGDGVLASLDGDSGSDRVRSGGESGSGDTSGSSSGPGSGSDGDDDNSGPGSDSSGSGSDGDDDGDNSGSGSSGSGSSGSGDGDSDGDSSGSGSGSGDDDSSGSGSSGSGDGDSDSSGSGSSGSGDSDADSSGSGSSGSGSGDSSGDSSGSGSSGSGSGDSSGDSSGSSSSGSGSGDSGGDSSGSGSSGSVDGDSSGSVDGDSSGSVDGDSSGSGSIGSSGADAESSGSGSGGERSGSSGDDEPPVDATPRADV